jgi:hypothetical protein
LVRKLTEGFKIASSRSWKSPGEGGGSIRIAGGCAGGGHWSGFVETHADRLTTRAAPQTCNLFGICTYCLLGTSPLGPLIFQRGREVITLC